MTRIRGRSTAVILLAAGSVLTSACAGGGTASPASTPVPTKPPATSSAITTTSTSIAAPPTLPPPSTPAPVTTTIPPDIPRMPLTGEPISDPGEVPDRPALAVKMDNIGIARPQAGLNQADIVFEEIINDGATRLAAVFHSQDADLVGPVRSGRYPDIHILEAFDRPLFAWSGGNGGVTYYIERSQLVDLSALHTSGYFRRAGREAPQDLYSTTEDLWTHAEEDAGPPPAVLQYLRPDEVLEGEPATVIEVELDSQRVRWEWDPEAELYRRWHNDRVHESEGDGQVTTNNVVVMLANYLPSPIDADTPDAQMLAAKPVYVFSGGTVRVGTWLRWAPTDRYAFYVDLATQEEIHLVPGRTFIELPRDVDGVVSWT